MPTVMGLGIVESCRLAPDIGYLTSGERDLPRFGAIDEVIPLRPACLILSIGEIDYNGAAKELCGDVFAEEQGF
jgi:hypothetical protein